MVETPAPAVSAPPRSLEALVKADMPETGLFLATAPVCDQQGPITPTPAWYVLQHFPMPEPLAPEAFELRIDGHVQRRLTVGFEELRRFPARSVRVTMECAGNDSQYFDTRHGAAMAMSALLGPSRAESGIAASGGEFTGVPLAAVLQAVGLRAGAVSVRAEGRDVGTPSPEMMGLPPPAAPIEPFAYDKGLPLDKALHPDTLLAWALNGEALTHHHGAPVRLVVPGWSGNWSVKWLRRIEVLDHPATCWWQTEYYYLAQSPDGHRELLTTLPVKSMVTHPRDDSPTLAAGPHVLRGLAWSGAGAISRVEVSVNGGKTWQAAHLEEPRERWLWTRWSLPVTLRAGSYRIMAKASDETGRTQPKDAHWNYLLKHFDGIIPVDITVK